MKRLLTHIMFVSLLQLKVYGQVPEKPNDISPVLVGEKIPDSRVQTLYGLPVSTDELLGKSKLNILIYYKGSWSSPCNDFMEDMTKLKDTLAILGVQVIAVCPDEAGRLQESVNKRGYPFVMISDVEAELMENLGIAYEATGKGRRKLADYSSGKNPDMMPVPALFITDEKGIVLFEHITPDRKARIQKTLLLAVVWSLKNNDDKN